MDNVSENKFASTKRMSWLRSVFVVLVCAVIFALGVVCTPSIAMASEEKSGIAAILPDMVEFVPMIIAFILVALILYKFGWPKFEGMLKKREDTIKEALEESEAKRLEAEKLLEQYKQKLEEAEEKSDKILKAAKQSASNLTQELEAQAKEKADAITRKSLESIDQAKKTAEHEIKKEAVDIAVTVVKKIVSEDMTDDEHRKLVEKYLEVSESLT